MQFSKRRPALFTLPLLAAFIVAACDSGGTGPVEPDPPEITISGVTEGTTYPGPVTIGITIDRGTYTASVDGRAFLPGGTVATPGPHTLVVTARDGLATTTRTIHFTIQGAPGGALIIRMLNLGPNDGAPGDAILITDSTSAGRVHVLVDAGPSGLMSQDNGFVARTLPAYGVDTLALMLLTHAHGDHYLGMTDVLNQFEVGTFLYNGQVRTFSTYTNVIATANTRADSVIALSGAQTRDYTIGYADTPTTLRFVPPLPTYINQNTGDGDLLNEGSVGMRLQVGTFDMFFTGDGEVEANLRWRTQFPALTTNVDVLKVGHHGANNAIFDNGVFGTSAWVDHTSPNVSIISGNGVSHPRVNALNRLLGQPDNITYCTNVHGVITITVQRTGAYTVTVEKNAGMNCVPGSEATT